MKLSFLINYWFNHRSKLCSINLFDKRLAIKYIFYNFMRTNFYIYIYIRKKKSKRQNCLYLYLGKHCSSNHISIYICSEAIKNKFRFYVDFVHK